MPLPELAPMIATLTLALFQAVAAPPPPAPQGSDVTVTASRDPERELKQFVDALTTGPANGQIGRFSTAVCPLAWGIPAAQATAVTARFRKVAAAAGLEVDSGKCVPNVLILVTHDKRRFVQALAKRYPYWFADPIGGNPIRMSREPGPAIAWHVPGAQLARGAPIPSMGTEVLVNKTTESGSRIGFATRPQFAAAIMVVEAGALVGLSTTQLADHAVMRTLLTTRPDRVPGGVDTILGVLDAPVGSHVPLSLTARDLTALKSFYASDPNASTEQQRAAVRRGLRSDGTRRE